jgi:hypothetical protein
MFGLIKGSQEADAQGWMGERGFEAQSWRGNKRFNECKQTKTHLSATKKI